MGGDLFFQPRCGFLSECRRWLDGPRSTQSNHQLQRRLKFPALVWVSFQAFFNAAALFKDCRDTLVQSSLYTN
jgi:hypothetical protein